MRNLKSIRVGLLGTVAATGIALVVAIAAPATAAVSGSLAPIDGTSAPTQTDYRAKLENLSNEQTAQDIATIMASGGHIEVLVDSATGRELAALKAGPDGIAPFALSPVGPGCTTTSLCMSTANSIFYGFTGTGALGGSWSPIIRVTPGNTKGSFDWNGLRNTYAAGVVVNLTSAVTVTRISRG